MSKMRKLQLPILMVPTDSNESECFIHEQVLVQYLLINIFWNEKYAISKGHQKALNINVDLGKEA